MFKLVIGDCNEGFVVIPGFFEDQGTAQVFAAHHFWGRHWTILPTP